MDEKQNMKKKYKKKKKNKQKLEENECFNSPFGETKLNTSFEEDSSSKESENDIEYKFLNDASIKYCNGFDII